MNEEQKLRHTIWYWEGEEEVLYNPSAVRYDECEKGI